MTKDGRILFRDWHHFFLAPISVNSLVEHQSRQIFVQCGFAKSSPTLRIEKAPGSEEPFYANDKRVLVKLMSTEMPRWEELKETLSANIDGKTCGFVTCFSGVEDLGIEWRIEAEVFLSETLFESVWRRLDLDVVPKKIYMLGVGITTDEDEGFSIWNAEEAPYLTIDDFHLDYEHLTPTEEKDE